MPADLRPAEALRRPDATVHVRRGGDPHGPIVVALHGFTQDGTCWAPYVRRRPDLDWWVPDLRGHGRTGAVDLHGREPLTAYGFDAVVGDIGALAERAAASGGGGRGVNLVGYSMGGRLALCSLVADPTRWTHVCVIGANPGLADADERSARAQADDALAAEIVRDGLDAFVARWERLALFAGLASAPDDVRATIAAARHAHDPVALAAMLRGTSVGRMPDLRADLVRAARAGKLPPLVAVAGADDSAYVARAVELGACGVAQTVLIPDAGHAAHLERPDATVDLVTLT